MKHLKGKVLIGLTGLIFAASGYSDGKNKEYSYEKKEKKSFTVKYFEKKDSIKLLTNLIEEGELTFFKLEKTDHSTKTKYPSDADFSKDDNIIKSAFKPEKLSSDNETSKMQNNFIKTATPKPGCYCFQSHSTGGDPSGFSCISIPSSPNQC